MSDLEETLCQVTILPNSLIVFQHNLFFAWTSATPLPKGPWPRAETFRESARDEGSQSG
jgi:hypothetical protein